MEGTLLAKVALLFDETPVADAIDPANFAINVEHIAAAARAATIKGSTIERSSTGATIANGDTLLYGYVLTGTSKQDIADDVFILGNLVAQSTDEAVIRNVGGMCTPGWLACSAVPSPALPCDTVTAQGRSQKHTRLPVCFLRACSRQQFADSHWRNCGGHVTGQSCAALRRNACR